ncbi:Poly (ADP-ribose) glycohydrolase family protein [Rhynchospora pubera]|uniref:Poly (ADP-ribose) glycohydrolase family protein n=1 Tax=Rhynchospora pubera TaxID=906938 RepID=A0AAV8C0L9_9POAL|nr:Poly (ADP-ribose) glycohydrolase family protein [Rhynchospora pubera]
MLPFLPISISTTSFSLSHLAWPEEAERALKDLTLGPAVSHVDTGARLFTFICKLRDVLGFSSQPPLAFGASSGFSLFFDHYLSRDEAKVWFDEVVPGLGALSLRLPSLLEAHYCKSKELNGIANCELRILGSQDAGIVILNRIFTSGSIEDQSHDALEVVFSNESFGGNSLYMGCVQEQIRFMINPELVGGMLFMTSMDNNEAIEVVGVERYTQYTGYGSSFCFNGDFSDKKPVDSMGKGKTKILAIDALNKPSEQQCEIKFLLRSPQTPPADGKTASTCKSASNEKANGDENQNEQGNGNENGLADDKAAITLDYSSKKLEGKTTEDFFSWLQSAESTNSVHARANGLSGSKRDPDRTRQDDRPNRVKRKPVWLSDYVTMMR